MPKHRPLSLWGVLGVVLLLAGGCQLYPSSSETPSPTPISQSGTDLPISTQDADLGSATPFVTFTPIPGGILQPDVATATPGKPTLLPTKTLIPSRTPTSTATRYIPPTRTPYPSNTPRISPTPLPPLADMRILRPGPYSKIISPISIEAGATPGDDGLVLVDLIGEDGRTIARQRLDYRDYIGRSIGIAPSLEFTIPGVAETARLVLSSEDLFGRKISVASIEVVLQSIGDNQIYQPGYQDAPFIIREPVADEVYQGGKITVSGLARPLNLSPLIFEAIDEKGQVVASGQLQIPLPGGDQSHTPFSIDIPYKVSISTRVRLTVRQASDDRIPGNVALWSAPVLLLP